MDTMPPIEFKRNPATYRGSLWLAAAVLALAYFSAIEPIPWLTAFNLLIAALLMTNYIVLRTTPVLRVDDGALQFNRTLWKRYRHPLAGLTAADEDERRFALRWRDGTTIAMSRQHFLERDLPDVAAYLAEVIAGTDAGN